MHLKLGATQKLYLSLPRSWGAPLARRDGVRKGEAERSMDSDVAAGVRQQYATTEFVEKLRGPKRLRPSSTDRRLDIPDRMAICRTGCEDGCESPES
jgi:hypothetical protein